MPDRFPYLPVVWGRGDASLMPLVPLELRFKGSASVQAHGLLDSGATVNVLPYALDVRLGAVWEAQTTRVTLTGILAPQDARALLVHAHVSDFASVPLVLAWTRGDNVPVLLGQVNFFEEFDVCFHRARRQFEFEPARKAFEIEKSPIGTAELRDIAWKTAHHFNRPSGTRFPLPPIPTVETVGYCLTSLRDWDGANAALSVRKEARA